MKVLKFGGTSLGTPARMQHIAKLIGKKKPSIVVLSAIGGTTNSLYELIELLHEKKTNEAIAKLDTLFLEAIKFSSSLLKNEETLEKMQKFLLEIYNELLAITKGDKIFIKENENVILSKGELVSTQLFSFYLDELKVEHRLIPALDFMFLDSNGEPDIHRIQRQLSALIGNDNSIPINITQGFICRTYYKQVSNLKRGGSDYSASIIGAALKAKEIQIWTDIDGMHNNDPRIINDTRPVPQLSYQEAAELAYFGAKILHPSTVHPASQAGIPIRIKNTMQPFADGTIITSKCTGLGVKAIAAKDNITAIRIGSSRMLMAYGFLKSIFEIFEKHQTAIDMITTSEVAVSLTIDDSTKLPSIINELKKLGVVEITTDQVIICIAGYFPPTTFGYAADILNALKDIPLRMVSFGGSEHNISLLVEKKFKESALQSLHKQLFIESNV